MLCTLGHLERDGRRTRREVVPLPRAITGGGTGGERLRVVRVRVRACVCVVGDTRGRQVVHAARTTTNGDRSLAASAAAFVALSAAVGGEGEGMRGSSSLSSSLSIAAGTGMGAGTGTGD